MRYVVSNNWEGMANPSGNWLRLQLQFIYGATGQCGPGSSFSGLQSVIR